MRPRRVTATFYPSELMRIYHAREVEVDGGLTDDPVDVACKFYLLWQLDYSEAAHVSLVVEGMPEMSAALEEALFGSKLPRCGS
jgi:hypothetical protein